jgi:hypothetical protein
MLYFSKDVLWEKKGQFLESPKWENRYTRRQHGDLTSLFSPQDRGTAIIIIVKTFSVLGIPSA